MRRKLFLLVAVLALAGVANMEPASGQADKGRRDELAGKLARREIQRSPLSIPGREMVQVETLMGALGPLTRQFFWNNFRLYFNKARSVWKHDDTGGHPQPHLSND
jgi:hypothetical protein